MRQREGLIGLRLQLCDQIIVDALNAHRRDAHWHPVAKEHARRGLDKGRNFAVNAIVGGKLVHLGRVKIVGRGVRQDNEVGVAVGARRLSQKEPQRVRIRVIGWVWVQHGKDDPLCAVQQVSQFRRFLGCFTVGRLGEEGFELSKGAALDLRFLETTFTVGAVETQQGLLQGQRVEQGEWLTLCCEASRLAGVGKDEDVLAQARWPVEPAGQLLRRRVDQSDRLACDLADKRRLVGEGF